MRDAAERAPIEATAPVPPRRVLVAILRSRLLHFVLLGGLVFWLAPAPRGGRGDVVIDGAALRALEDAQAQRLGTPRLSPDEEREVRTRAVEDEILYREALRLGLDRDDNVVRQRLVQKVLFLAEDLAGVSRQPTEAELRAFFEATRGQWTRPSRVRFVHVYAAPNGRDRLAALHDRAATLEIAAPGTPPALGDAFPLPRAVTGSHDDVANQYGAAFADAVLALPPGAWSEPIASKFGWHLVLVLERTDAGPAEFEDVRPRLPLLYLVARKKEAAREFLRQAAGRYRIVVDGAPLRDLPPSDRVAPPRGEGVD
jgi:peptidyl-prolyl cis-trans isomerase C